MVCGESGKFQAESGNQEPEPEKSLFKEDIPFQYSKFRAQPIVFRFHLLYTGFIDLRKVYLIKLRLCKSENTPYVKFIFDGSAFLSWPT
jgi:hypothetical protein